jgi:hypothetical protein
MSVDASLLIWRWVCEAQDVNGLQMLKMQRVLRQRGGRPKTDISERSTKA